MNVPAATSTVRRSLKWVVLTLIASYLSFQPTGPAGARTASKPNVLVIVTDDQPAAIDTYEVMPETMRLFKREGTWFPYAVATTPLCCPSRASIFSGKYVHNHGIRAQNPEGFDALQTVPYELQKEGYLTAVIGKYLNNFDGDPQGFDRWAITTEKGDRVTYTGAEFNVDGSLHVAPGYATSFVEDTTVSILEDFEKEDDKPWLLYVAPDAPHLPAVPEEQYRDSEVPVWEENPATREGDRTDKPSYVQGLSLFSGEQAVPVSQWLYGLILLTAILTIGFAFLGASLPKRNTLIRFLLPATVGAFAIFVFSSIPLLAWVSLGAFGLAWAWFGLRSLRHEGSPSSPLALATVAAGGFLMALTAFLTLIVHGNDRGYLLVMTGRSIPSNGSFALFGVLLLSMLLTLGGVALLYAKLFRKGSLSGKVGSLLTIGAGLILTGVITGAVVGEVAHKTIIKETRADQLRTLISVDDMVARLFSELGDFDEDRDTLAFFLSDNGYLWYEHRLTGKRFPYNQSVQIPFFARWPGHLDAGATSDEIVANIDVAATVYDAAGIEPKYEVDGRSVLSPVNRDEILVEYWREKRAGIPTWSSLWTPSWTYVEYPGTGALEYYDSNDPWQLDNLFSHSSEGVDPATANDLSERLDQYRNCSGGACP